jgi:DNA-binding response OmpR family regulator
MRVLLVEDEAEFANAVRGALEREMFVVDHVERIDAARAACHMNTYDLVLLDRTLPDGDGLSLVPTMRAAIPGLAVLAMTARGEISDRVAGLDGGADDYLVKPFALEELFARIRAVRRRPTALESEEIRVASLVLEVASNDAWVNGAKLKLARRERRVLTTLIKRRGRTVLREWLEQNVFGSDDSIQSNTLDSHVSRLRRKLNAAGAGVEIQAIKGVGYLLRESS